MTTETTVVPTTEAQAIAPIVPAIAAPVIPQATPTTPVVAQATDTAVKGAKVDMTSAQLTERLAEERRKGGEASRADLLKALGVTDETTLKAAVAEAKRLQDEKLSDIEKRDKRLAELEPRALRADALEAALKSQVDAAMATLTDAQRGAVEALAGTDTLKQLHAITVLKGALPAAPIAPPAVIVPPIAAPLNTGAPAPPAPTGAVTAAVDHLSIWDSLKRTHPIHASQYYLNNIAAIVAAQKARG